MAELIYSVEKVFSEYLGNDKLYNIPEYQRGYKWTELQVRQLLKDIHEFDTGGDEDLFYCLQNITLVEKEGNYNVVDGQQRLTTLALLLSFFNESALVQNKIHYAVRQPSNSFLQCIISNENNFIGNIIASKSVDELEAGSDYDFQDIYFMYSAIRSINLWFVERDTEAKPIDRAVFKEKLLNNVKLIVNLISGIEEQELFMNLNAGRVHLDGSDLVRAILITRVAKQEMDENDSSEIKTVVRLNERRVRIGWELDELNAWWSKKDVSAYFTPFTNIKTGEKESIKFNQEKHPINLLYKLWSEINQNTEREIRLSLFETKNTNALDLYISIIQLHRTLKDWYEDREIYHFLGFLFFQKVVTFQKIWKEWNKTNNTRNEFICNLKAEIKKAIFGNEPKDGEEEESGMKFWLDKIKDYNNESPTYWKGVPELQKILLLLDIIVHSNEKEKGIPLPFLKPMYFKNQKEDEEHIYPATPQDITEKRFKDLPDPMSSIENYLVKLNIGYDSELLIKWGINSDTWQEMSSEIKNEKLGNLKADIHQKRPINSIGNLVLLHLSINRGFGNDYYTDKRISVINNTENGEYVRQHTLKVFVKHTESIDLNDWTMKDITSNADKIHDTLFDFFKVEKKEVNNG
jgi:hypothetical protein